jgi:hypothetical protein
MNSKLKELLGRVETWPESDQAELVELAEHIEIRHRGYYNAAADELRAIDAADHSGVATEKDVEAAFKTFRHEG